MQLLYNSIYIFNFLKSFQALKESRLTFIFSLMMHESKVVKIAVMCFVAVAESVPAHSILGCSVALTQ